MPASRVTVNTWAVEDADGNKLRRRIVAVLHAGEGGGSVDGLLIAKWAEATTDATTGIATFQLYSNDDIDQAGSFYSFTVCDVDPTVVRRYEIPAGAEVDLPDLTEVEPVGFSGYVPNPASGSDGDVLTVAADGTYDLGPVRDEKVAVAAATVPNLTALNGWSGTKTQEQVDVAVDGLLGYLYTTSVSEASTRAAADTALDGRLDTAEATLTVLLDAGSTLGDVALVGASHDTEAAYFEACVDFGGSHYDRAWTTPPPGDFTDGLWIEAELTVRPLVGIPSPTDGQEVYSEIATQPHDGIGSWDNFEFAVLRKWSASLGRWRNYLYWEHTPIGGVTDSYKLNGGTSGNWEIPENVPTRVAVWIDFTDGTNSVGRLLRRTWSASPDHTYRGYGWRVVDTKTASPTSVDTGVTDDWGIGMDSGRLHISTVEFRNGGPTGTLMASPNAADAIAADAGGTTAFNDDQTNTWTPGVSAIAIDPAATGGGVSLGETPTTAYRGDRGKIAYDYSQAHTGATDPHGDRAYSVARANHTGTQAASTVTGLPWLYQVCIEPSSQKPNTFTTWTPTQSAVLGGGYAAGATSVSGETWTYAGLPLKAGTWALDLVIRKTSSSGIITCSLGGSSVGTADGYNASNLGDQRVVVSSSITVASDGQYDLVLTNPTKNASAGGYGWTIQVIDLRRTGA